MNISLRKASALQAVIQDSINQTHQEIQTSSRISLSEFANPKETMIENHDKLFTGLSKSDNLSMVYYEIRKQLGNSNVKSGISDLLAELAYINKKISFLEEISVAHNLQTKMEIIIGKLDKAKKAAENAASYYDADRITTGLLTQAEINDFKSQIANLKKEKVAINDSILEKNITNTITLSEKAVDILKTNNLI
jgi:hypothetical protein